MNSGGYVCWDMKHWGVYLLLFTDPEGDSCFSIYQISLIKLKKVTFCQLKMSRRSNFVYSLQTFQGFCQVHFTILLQIQHEIIFYLPLNTDKPKFINFLVFVCTTASFIREISSSKNVSKRDVKDVSSYGSQSKHAKIAVHWFLVNTNTE